MARQWSLLSSWVPSIVQVKKFVLCICPANSLLGVRKTSSTQSVSSSAIFNYITDVHATVNDVTKGLTGSYQTRTTVATVLSLTFSRPWEVVNKITAGGPGWVSSTGRHWSSSCPPCHIHWLPTSIVFTLLPQTSDWSNTKLGELSTLRLDGCL